MKKQWKDLTILLVQIREETKAIDEEYASFKRNFKLEAHQLVQYNALLQPIEFLPIERFDAVVIGGAGAFSIRHEHTFYPKLDFLMSILIKHHKPLLGVCWGHQYIGRYFGAHIVRDEHQFEYGSIEIILKDEAKEDPIISILPDCFSAYTGHEDSISVTTDDIISMAYSGKSDNQIIKVKGYPIYGVQFHPDLTKTALQKRMLIYKSYLSFPNNESFYKTYHSVTDSNEAQRILQQFIRVLCVKDDLIA